MATSFILIVPIHFVLSAYNTEIIGSSVSSHPLLGCMTIPLLYLHICAYYKIMCNNEQLQYNTGFGIVNQQFCKKIERLRYPLKDSEALGSIKLYYRFILFGSN